MKGTMDSVLDRSETEPDPLRRAYLRFNENNTEALGEACRQEALSGPVSDAEAIEAFRSKNLDTTVQLLVEALEEEGFLLVHKRGLTGGTETH